MLFTLLNYADIVFMQDTNNIRIDFYNSTGVSSSVVFNEFQMRYQSWMLININVTVISAILTVDGKVVSTKSFKKLLLPSTVSEFIIA